MLLMGKGEVDEREHLQQPWHAVEDASALLRAPCLPENGSTAAKARAGSA